MKTTLFPIVMLILITACTSSGAMPQEPEALPFDPAPGKPAPVFTAIPTLTALPPAPTYGIAPLDDAQNIVYYFAPDICNAKWVNSGQELPCPGIHGQISSGYVEFLTQADLGLNYMANALLTIPSQDRKFFGIFGTFPAREIEFADFFRTQLYCMPGSLCDVTFSIGYYDSNGKFYEPFPDWSYNYTEPSHLINYPLDTLDGQTVKLTLIVRDNGNSSDDFAVWVEPRIFRHPGITRPTP